MVSRKHGGIAQAGKVRKITPKVEGKKRKSPSPRVSNKEKYYKRVELGRESGQNASGRRRRRY